MTENMQRKILLEIIKKEQDKAACLMSTSILFFGTTIILAFIIGMR